MPDPEQEWTIGGDIDQVNVTLRVAAPDLDPEQITRLLGVTPTFAARRGDPRRSKGTKQPTGIWLLELPRSEEWVLADAIAEVLRQVPSDPSVWRQLAASSSIDVFCGLYLYDFNRGLDLPPALLADLGTRGIALTLDVYCEGSQDDADA